MGRRDKTNPGPLPVRAPPPLSAAEFSEPALRLPPPQSATTRRPSVCVLQGNAPSTSHSPTSGTLPSLSPSRSPQRASDSLAGPRDARAMSQDRHSRGSADPLSPDVKSPSRSAVGGPLRHTLPTGPAYAPPLPVDVRQLPLTPASSSSASFLASAAATPTSGRGAYAAGPASDSLAALRRARNDAQPVTLGNPSMLRHLDMRKKRRLTAAAKKQHHSSVAASTSNSGSGFLLHSSSGSQKLDRSATGPPPPSPSTHTPTARSSTVFSRSMSAVQRSGSSRSRHSPPASEAPHGSDPDTPALLGAFTTAPFVLHSEESEELVRTTRGLEKRRHTAHEVRLPAFIASSLYPREYRAGEGGEGSRDRESSTPRRSQREANRSHDSPTVVEAPQTAAFVPHTPRADAPQRTGLVRVSGGVGRHCAESVDVSARRRSDSSLPAEPRSPCAAGPPPAKTKVGISFRSHTAVERLALSPAGAETSATSVSTTEAGSAVVARTLPTTPLDGAATPPALFPGEHPREIKRALCDSADSLSAPVNATTGAGLSSSLQSPEPSVESLSYVAASSVTPSAVISATTAAADPLDDSHVLSSPGPNAASMSLLPRHSRRPSAPTPSLLSRGHGGVRSASVASSSPPPSAFDSYGTTPLAGAPASTATSRGCGTTPGGGRVGWAAVSAASSSSLGGQVGHAPHVASGPPKPSHRVHGTPTQVVTSLSVENDAFLDRLLGNVTNAAVDSTVRMC